MKVPKAAACLLAAMLPASLCADNARFDLGGPNIDVRVTRGNVTLPIAQVPNLQPGDKIWVKADLPTTQSNHLLVIVAFLRGTTNEPPDDWFTEIDTWEKKTVEGTTITVPDGAEQALMFVAPETGGDFKTLRSAVKGKPGLFIRADNDLNEASFEQQRIERYLAAMKTVSQDDTKSIQDHSAKLATTLNLKPNADCFKQPVELQVNCLTQSSAPVLLDDGHGQSIADSLSTGATSDFINAASYTQAAGAGVYSAYVGAVVDLVHLVSTLHTAQYQYIPAISFPQGSTLNLKLNAPPSFHNPKSVIVIGLPAIQKAKLPPLKPHDPDEVACLLQPKMTLALQGAPLVFSTSFAHDMVLHLNRPGNPSDIPLTPDAFEGGLQVTKPGDRQPLHDVPATNSDDKAATPVASAAAAKPGSSDGLTVTGTVRGAWGFDTFEGPTMTLQQAAGKDWKVISNTQMMAGQDNHLTLQGDGTACVQHIGLLNGDHKDLDVSYKPASGDGGKQPKGALDLDVPLKTVQPGGYSLAIAQFGDAPEAKVPITAYNGGIKLSSLKMHAGDAVAVLSGQGLQDVVSVDLAGQSFTPKAGGSDNVQLAAKNGVSPDNGAEATVKLKDGRTMPVKVEVEAARPGLQLLSLRAVPAPQPGTLPVVLGSKDEIPLDGKVTFVVQTKNEFPQSQTIEVATADEAVHTVLSLASENLVLQDQHTAIATLEPAKAFGRSAFGKLQMRPVAADGTPGNWTPLGNLVRTPQITAVQCTTAAAPTCTVDGSQLFLVQAFGAGKDLGHPTDVPTGFAENSIAVPTPTDGSTIFLKLRDDPEAVASVTLPKAVPAAPAPAAATDGASAAPSARAADPATTKAGTPAAPTTPAMATAPAGASPKPTDPAAPQAPAVPTAATAGAAATPAPTTPATQPH